MRIKRYLAIPAKLLFSIGLIVLLYRTTPVGSIAELLLGIDGRFLMLVPLLLLSNTLVSALKWQQLLAADGIMISFRTLVASYLIGSFYNMFLPTNIGGDSYRVYDVARRSRQTTRAAISVLADRISGFLAMLTIGLCSSLAVGSMFSHPALFLTPLLILLVVTIVLYALFNQRPAQWLLTATGLGKIGPIRSAVETVSITMARYGTKRSLLVRVMLLSFLFQFSVYVIVFMLSRAIHAEVPFIYFCIFVPIVTLLEVLPISINGLGVRDAGYIVFFGSVGMSDIETRSLALLFLAMSVCYSLSGGLVYIIRTMWGTTPAKISS